MLLSMMAFVFRPHVLFSIILGSFIVLPASAQYTLDLGTVPVGEEVTFIITGFHGITSDGQTLIVSTSLSGSPDFFLPDPLPFNDCSAPRFPNQNLCYVYLSFKPMTPGVHTVVAGVTNTVHHPEYGTSSSSFTITVNAVSSCGTLCQVDLNIANVRVAQRVFEPDGLVTKKPYAVEVTLAGTVPESARELKAVVNLYVDDVLKGSSPQIRIGDITGSDSKLFIFSQEDLAGAKNIRVQLLPATPVTGVFDQTHEKNVTRSVSFHETKLSLLVAEITGCLPGLSIPCFSAPTTEEKSFFNSVQVPWAEKMLPISQGNLSVINGLNYSLSNPGSIESIYRDSYFLWAQKKITFSDLGIFVVGNNYFSSNAIDSPGKQTLGLVLSSDRRFAFVRGTGDLVLAHELYHTLGVNHSASGPTVEGVGENSGQIWASGRSLDPSVNLRGAPFDLMLENLNGLPEDFNPNQSSYNKAFATIQSEDLDPKVILVGVILDAANNAIFSEVQKAEAYLDLEPQDSDTVVEGLNANGQVVSAVQTLSVSSVEAIRDSGEVDEIESSSSLITATLPDDGTIQTIRIIKNGQIVYSRAVERLTLEKIINGLGTEDFKMKPIPAKVALQLIQIEFKNYQKLKTLKNKVPAKVALRLLYETLRNTAKPNFVLQDGTPVSLEEVLDIIREEAKLLN